VSSYPNSIKYFINFIEFYDINYAEHMNEIRDEVAAIEATLGAGPFDTFSPIPYTSLAQALSDLYANKARVNHIHAHSTEEELASNLISNEVHSQYIPIDGSVDFSNPVFVPPATEDSHFIPVGQFLEMELIGSDPLQEYINAQFEPLSVGAANSSSYNWLFGTSPIGVPTNYLFGSGYNEAITTTSGTVNFTFTDPFQSGIMSLVIEKSATGLGTPNSGYPGYVSGVWQGPPYTLLTSRCTLSSCNLTGFSVLFTNSSGVPLNTEHVAFTWYAVGV
jgi:hypothetical protein